MYEDTGDKIALHTLGITGLLKHWLLGGIYEIPPEVVTQDCVTQSPVAHAKVGFYPVEKTME